MSSRQSFIRKIKYLAAIVVLLLPLSWLSKPAAIGPGGQKSQRGGMLAQLRDEHRLSQANLGEIDPTSEAIKLATLGMRGVAANILWSKANHYRKVEDWTNLSATLEQITRLQPNFITVWRYQAWNLSYNISVEWDDYRDRYFWVIKGINFLKEGTRYNEEEPMLLWDVGWITSHKIGQADERVQFRRLFRDDDDFHGSRPMSQRDNWLVGQEWFRAAENLVDNRGVPLRSMSPLIFHSKAPLCQINYATALQEDGHFGDVARHAWDQAAQQWRQFGDRELQIADTQHRSRLSAMPDHLAAAHQATQELDALAPGLRHQMHEEKVAALSEDDRALLSMPAAEMTAPQRRRGFEIFQQIQVSNEELVERMPEAQREQATALASRAEEQLKLANYLNSHRQVVNYDYWAMRCDAERTDDALKSRELLFQANQYFDDADLESARQAYEGAFEHWRNVLDRFPPLVEDGITGDDMYRVVSRYNRLLKQLDEPFPEDFILKDLVEEQSYGSLDPPPQ